VELVTTIGLIFFLGVFFVLAGARSDFVSFGFSAVRSQFGFLQRHSSSPSSALAASGVSREAWPRSRSLVSLSASVRHPRSAGQKPSPLLCSVCDSPIGLLGFSHLSIFLLISNLAAIICS
jgi:hypothetical protein